MSCPHPNADHHRFCTTCGEALLRQNCTCGAHNLLSDQFCHSCGHILNAQEIDYDASNPVINPSIKPDLATLIQDISNTMPNLNHKRESIDQTDIDDLFRK